MEKNTSNITGKEYNLCDVCRIVNPKQQLLYIKNNIYPIDIYTSINPETNGAILVMIFEKEASYPLYQKWCNHELV